MRNKQWISDEVMMFDIPVGQVTEFLEQRGFTQIENADHTCLHDFYFKGASARQTVAYGHAIALALVK